ncbi:MAG: GntR family transcriptional regulator [Sandaracinaceae bacterium]
MTYRRSGAVRGIVVDLQGATPLYRQIADEVRALIARGQLKEDETLPSVRALGELLGVNLNTVAKAYRLLAEEGVIDLKHGASARVLAPPEPARHARLDAEAVHQLEDAIGKLRVRGASRDAVAKAFDAALRRFYEDEEGAR